MHGTAVAAAGRGALIRGASGSGKSDLALRCLMHAPSPLLPNAVSLISDDRVAIEVRAGALIASPPPAIAGLLEVRGLGLYRFEYTSEAPVAVVVDLVASDKIERLPVTKTEAVIAGISIPLIQLAAFDASAATKLLLALSPDHQAIQ
ncbi:MAG: HPr kinase/phosphatase C-terminal domain-containing protein [Alphaproteobacteria bacterium]|nr:HPr kinase/phosphatase C-terminal domain-containing protein [Alphaproteobacteria bacterium]